jgi:hypothetical protein
MARARTGWAIGVAAALAFGGGAQAAEGARAGTADEAEHSKPRAPSEVEPGSMAGQEKNLNAENASKGTGRSADAKKKSRKVKHKTKKQKTEAGEAAGAGGSTDRTR